MNDKDLSPTTMVVPLVDGKAVVGAGIATRTVDATAVSVACTACGGSGLRADQDAISAEAPGSCLREAAAAFRADEATYREKARLAALPVHREECEARASRAALWAVRLEALASLREDDVVRRPIAEGLECAERAE